MYVKRYKSKALRGKWRVSRYLSAVPGLRRLVPQTAPLSLPKLREMARTYRMLYIKPDVGSLGIGIYRLQQLSGGGYALRSTAPGRRRARTYRSLSAVYRTIRAESRTRLIVQRGVRLARVGRSPYDIRAMVQRKPGGPWTCTGFLVKVGKPGKIVTNYYQGGRIETIERLLGRLGRSPESRKRTIAGLSAVAVRVARALSARRSGMHEMGIDFAYDAAGRLWVLEVNSNHPQFHPLKRLDRTAYDRMASYARSYGRRDD